MRILRVVGSGLLPCGCFVGLYETYSGPTVQIIEERGVSCRERDHEPGAQIAPASTSRPATPDSSPAARPAA
jgi:hypothetical protein